MKTPARPPLNRLSGPLASAIREKKDPAKIRRTSQTFYGAKIECAVIDAMETGHGISAEKRDHLVSLLDAAVVATDPEAVAANG